MLKVRSIHTYYGAVHVLKAASLHVAPGEIVAVIGANGAGKTTLLKSIAGTVLNASGRIVFLDQEVAGAVPEHRLGLGLALCPEGRRLFGGLSVEKNLLLGAYQRRDKAAIRQDLDTLRQRFPILDSLWHRPARTLSGGEQQMAALARSLMSRPRLLLLDEPSLGLSPLLAKDILKTIRDLNREDGLSVLLVEQNARAALRVAHRGYVLETGRVILEGSGNELLAHEEVQRAYLGKAYKEIWER
ncbi:MAG: ABC transporter ATP-binding protein [Thermodesulfobacteriota bacterium]